MEMQRKDVKGKMRDARDAFMNSRISRIGKRILEATEIIGRAVLFVVIVLAVELAVWGIMYSIYGRW